MRAIVAQQGLARAVREASLNLTVQEIEGIVQVEEACLTESERVCFDEGASTRLVRAFADSPCLAGNIAGELTRLIEGFYEIREDMPALVTDQEIVEELYEFFDGEAEGDVGLAISLARENLAASDSLCTYGISDDEGRVYRWNPDEWVDDVKADGWYGEHWSDHYE